MQYPLEGLHLLIRNTLHPSNLKVLYQQKNNEQITELIVTVAGQARISVCRYIAAAKNTQQVTFMLHGLRVALCDLLNTVAGHEEQLMNMGRGLAIQKKHITIHMA